LVPTSEDWQPTGEAAASVAAYVAELFSGSDGDVDEVTCEFYERVTLIDAGENTSQISCPHCDGEVSREWFLDLVEENYVETGEDLTLRDVTVPCCGWVVPLDELRYEWPVGFARFEVCIMNPTRANKYELDAGELDRVGALLGHPVTQVLAHY